MEHKRIKLSKLVQNNGQLDGVPKNPRQWSKDDVERLKRSIEETPELLQARGCIVYPLDDKYIVLGGNMRLTACKQLGHKEVDCVVLDADTTPEKLKEIVIKDNGSFGQWDDNTHDNMTSVWNFPRTSQKEREGCGGHATPKPIALCERAIKSSSREGDIVLDLFGGSGSTLIAAEQIGRKAYLMELTPHYCDVIIARWEKLTGKKAIKIS